jgi:hypothetical protein
MKNTTNVAGKSEEQTQASVVREKMISSIEKIKITLTHFLSRQSEKLSPAGKKVLLLVFGLLMGGISLYLMIEPFRNPVSAELLFSKQQIQKTIVPQPAPPLISQEEYVLLIGYKKKLDSLRRYDPQSYQILMHHRQGLLDSLEFLIRLYH